MNIKNFFAKNWAHFAVLGVFIIVTIIYFSPEFSGNGLKQHDIQEFKGMSNEIQYHREMTGEEPLWTNSMFGGMPATQISVQHHGNWFKSMIKGILSWFPMPAGAFFLHLICFYILALCLRIKPLIGLLGSLAFGFASYEIIILQAGHNSKALAVAFSPAVVGAFMLAFQRSWKWGAILSAIFMSMELAMNHFQVTYYIGILLFFLGIYFLVKAIVDKKIKEFGFATVGIVVGYLIALMINIGNINMTNDYAKYTIRGGNDVTITPEGAEATANTSGLDKDYITQWSYGIGESFTLISPYVKGSHSAALGATNFAEVAENSDLPNSTIKNLMDLPLYWGEQPITSGPVYLGVVVVFLAFLGLVLLKKKVKWVLFGVAVLALILSWGKNFMGFTEFFIDHVPGYNKFRTVTIILVLVELCIPVIAVLTLQQLWEERQALKERWKSFLIASGAFFMFLLVVMFAGLGDNYTSSGDQRIIDQYKGSILDQLEGMDPAVLKAQYQLDVNNEQQVAQFVNAQIEPIESNLMDMRIVRESIFKKSMTRSLVLTFFTIACMALLFFTAIPTPYVIGGLIVLLLADLVPVDLNYLSKETNAKGDFIFWVPQAEQAYPISSTAADLEIMQSELSENPELTAIVEAGAERGEKKADELGITGIGKRRIIDSYKFMALNSNTNYRVFELNNAWGSSRASYFHKSLGGYHGAKLRNIQNLFEFHISRSNNNVLNMLNVKYFIQGDKVSKNPGALGNAWLVKSVSEFETANDEILALGKKFSVKNIGGGKLLVNGEEAKEAEAFGSEKLVYLLPAGDSIPVPLSNGLNKGMRAVFVMDVNGNTNLVPEITLDLDTANSFAKLTAIEVSDDFEPLEEAVMLKSEAAKLSKKKFAGEGTVKMTSYAPNELTYSVNVKEDQLVVFSEIYYKDGWKAYVDGKEQEILKVDYLLRGLEVQPGSHKVEFRFDLPAYHKGEMMSKIGSAILVLLLIVVGYFQWKENKKTEVPEVE